MKFGIPFFEFELPKPGPQVFFGKLRGRAAEALRWAAVDKSKWVMG
jgi:hypothetical protein